MSNATLREAADYAIRRLQADINDGSRPDQWSMEDIVRKLQAALAADDAARGTPRAAYEAFCADWQASRAAAPQSVEPACRDDGRCQYAIDHGAEGLGHCPKGKCAMPSAPAASQPIDMVLHCPACGKQHIDTPEVYEPIAYSCECRGPDQCEGCYYAQRDWEEWKSTDPWTNPPHRSHLCSGCGHIWRPADVPTNGIQAVATNGKSDSPIAAAPQSAEPLTDDELPGMWPHADLIGGATDCVSPPAAPSDAQWAKQAYEMANALRAHLSTRAAAPQNVKPVAWLAYDGAHQLFIVGGNGPHDVYGGFPVYLHPAPTEADRLDAERYRWLRQNAHGSCEQQLAVTICTLEVSPERMDAAIDAAMSQEKRKDALDRMARDADELGLDF